MGILDFRLRAPTSVSLFFLTAKSAAVRLSNELFLASIVGIVSFGFNRITLGLGYSDDWKIWWTSAQFSIRLFLGNNIFLTLEILSRLSQFNPPSSFVGVPLGVILVGVVTICGDTNGDKSTSVKDERLLFRLLLLGLCWRWLPIDTFGSFLIIWSLGISCFFVFWMEELSLTWL